MVFKDRAQAGETLAKELEHYRAMSPVVVALPRGGVVVGAAVASALDAPLEILIVRKLGAPRHEELGIGAVVDLAGGCGDARGPVVLVDDRLVTSLGVDQAYIRREVQRQVDEIRRRENAYRVDRPMIDLTGRVVILVDDGIATGSTARAALEALRRCDPQRLILAVPVGPPDTIQAMRHLADDAVCPLTPSEFRAVGEFYDDFRQTTDEEVIDLLRRSWERENKGAS